MVQILVIPSSSGATGTVRDAVKLSNRQLGAFSQFTASMGTSYDFELAVLTQSCGGPPPLNGPDLVYKGKCRDVTDLNWAYFHGNGDGWACGSRLVVW